MIPRLVSSLGGGMALLASVAVVLVQAGTVGVQITVGDMAVILALLLQTGAIVFWGGRLWERVERLRRDLDGLHDWKREVAAPRIERNTLDIEVLKERMLP